MHRKNYKSAPESGSPTDSTPKKVEHAPPRNGSDSQGPGQQSANHSKGHNSNDPEQITEDSLHQLFGSSADVTLTPFTSRELHGCPCLLLYCEGMVDAKLLTQYVLPDLEQILESYTDWTRLSSELDKSLAWTLQKKRSDVVNLVFSGKLCVFFREERALYSIDVAQVPKRQPEESNTEVSVKGAKDGFTEEIDTNVALIRKRLKTSSLCNEEIIIGKRSQTRVSLLYMSDIIHPEVIKEVRNRLKDFSVDVLVGSSQLEEGISDSSLALFPLIDYIGRPDFAVESLVKGRFVIVIEGIPMALIGPTNLFTLLKTPEDAYSPYHFVIFERLLRLFGLIIAILLPGFWISVTSYNMDQLPLPLLATVTNSRYGLPFSAPVEMLIMLGMFEIFREAGIRLPKAVGQTIAVLGGLIVGDAAIRAGLTSPTMLVVAAVTAVSTFTLINQSLSGSVSIVRLFVILLSSFMGMFGFFIALVCIVAYLSILESFGLPYLAPVAPITWRDLMSALIMQPRVLHKLRPKVLKPVDKTLRKRGS